MKIFTVFDRRHVEDGWRSRIESAFGSNRTSYTHLGTLEEAIPLLKNRERCLVVFSSFGEVDSGGYTRLAPYFHKGQTAILFTGDLDKGKYMARWHEDSRTFLHTLDPVKFYSEVGPLQERIGFRTISQGSEAKG